MPLSEVSSPTVIPERSANGQTTLSELLLRTKGVGVKWRQEKKQRNNGTSEYEDLGFTGEKLQQKEPSCFV